MLKLLIFILTISFPSLLLAAPTATPRGTTSSYNVGRSTNFYRWSSYNGRAAQNSSNGYNYYTRSGRMYMRSYTSGKSIRYWQLQDED